MRTSPRESTVGRLVLRLIRKRLLTCPFIRVPLSAALSVCFAAHYFVTRTLIRGVSQRLRTTAAWPCWSVFSTVIY